MIIDEYRKLAKEFLEQAHVDFDNVAIEQNIEWLTRILVSVHNKAVEMHKLETMIQSLKDGALKDEQF